MIEQEAKRLRAPLRVAGQHWSIHSEHGRLVYQDDDGLLDLPLPKLAGRHQVENAGLAIATLRASGLGLHGHDFEAGIKAAETAVTPDFQFHLEIIRATGNAYYIDLFTQLGPSLIPRAREE